MIFKVVALILAVFVYTCVGWGSTTSSGIWELAETRGVVPLERPYAACDSAQGRMFVHGGRTGLASWANSVHSYDFEDGKWTKHAVQANETKSLPNLAGHTMNAIDKDTFVIFGGRSGLWTYSNELYLFDITSDTISKVETKGMKPTPRAKHTSTFVDGKLYIFGGSKDHTIYNDTFVYDIATQTWSQPEVTGSVPSGLEGHSATYAQGKIYILGGYEGNNRYNTKIYSFDPKTSQWKMLWRKSSPRAFHTASLIGNYIYLIGGYNGGNAPIGDVGLFDSLSEQFRNYKPGGKFPPRQGHCAVVGLHSLIFVFGGAKSASWRHDSTNELYILDTSPETRQKQGNTASLPERLELLMFNINSEILPNETMSAGDDKPIEEILEQKLAEQTDEFLDLPQKIALWHEIDRLYNEYLRTKRSMKDITSSVKFNIEETKKVGTGIDKLKGELGGMISSVHDGLTEYVRLRNDLESVKIERIQAEKLQKDNLGKIEALKDTIHIMARNQTRELDLTKQLERQKASIGKQLTNINKILENADHEYESLKAKEDQILEELKKIAESKGAISEDISGLTNQTLELEKVKRELDDRLLRIEELKKQVHELNKYADEGFGVLKRYVNLRNNIVQQVQALASDKQDVIKAKGKSIEIGDEDNTWIIELLDSLILPLKENRRKIIITLKGLMAKKSAETKETQALEASETSWKVKHEELKKKLDAFKQTQTVSGQQRQVLLKESDDVQVKLDHAIILQEEYTIELDRSKENLKNLQQKVKASKKSIDNLVKEEEKRNSKFNALVLVLEEKHAKLQRDYKEARILSSNLNRMRSKISTSKNIYDEEQNLVQTVRDKLLAKLQEAEKDLKKCEEEKIALKAKLDALNKQSQQKKEDITKIRKQLKK